MAANTTTTAVPAAVPSRQSLLSDPQSYTACYCEENALLLVRRLLSTPPLPGPPQTAVLFITNPRRTCPVWWQRSAGEAKLRRGEPVVWDYHVVALARWRAASTDPAPSPSPSPTPLTALADDVPPTLAPATSWGPWLVFDPDSVLPFPSPALGAGGYLRSSLLPPGDDDDDEEAAAAASHAHPRRRLPAQFEQRFRLVRGEDFVRAFASDRRHMRATPDPGTGHVGASVPPAWNSPPPVYQPLQGPAAAAAGLSHTLHRFLDVRLPGDVLRLDGDERVEGRDWLRAEEEGREREGTAAAAAAAAFRCPGVVLPDLAQLTALLEREGEDVFWAASVA
jgi:hypothetical protein